jgi:DNA mismatch repair protein MutS
MLDIINKTITDDPPSTLGDGKVIRAGFDPEMDKLCSLAGDARTFLSQMETRERERTGIKSLKLGYNRVFGYYIEISNANLGDVPPEFIRKQTLVNAERFITPELKEYENLILNAKERLLEMETGLYEQVLNQLGGFYSALLANATALAALDVLSAFAEVAVRNSYVRPVFHPENRLDIRKGRHPMVEQGLGYGSFVANDISLSAEDCQIIILTGPNMAGKSTYLKQTALIVLMAQIGSYVPAETAELCLTDRIFTRIGAREDLSAGQSTFMVEMVETASILNTATSRSLLILDEIGRGTSTYDGLAIAQAVVEYIHSQPSLTAKTLFATHYHELVELASYLPRVKNYNIAVSEDRGEVVFLHKIVPGGVDKSYGIHVAKLAGLPKWVIKRAYEVLTELENPAKKQPKSRTCQSQLQLPMTGQTSVLEEEIKELEIESLTPLAALNKLYELKKKAEEQGL